MSNMQNIIKTLDELKIDIKNYYIGCAIANKRNELGFSIEETAYYLHISSQDLKLYETGEKELTPDILYHLSRLFNVNVSSFFTALSNN